MQRIVDWRDSNSGPPIERLDDDRSLQFFAAHVRTGRNLSGTTAVSRSIRSHRNRPLLHQRFLLCEWRHDEAHVSTNLSA